MTQGLRTAIYVAVALLVGVVAFATRPSTPTVDLDEEVGDKLFPDLDDPAEVASLEITKYDEALAQLGDFKVALVDGAWSISSHDNYPADNVREMGTGENAKPESRVADAAASLMDLTIVGVDSSSARDHEGLGVVEPDPEKIKVGASGVGTLVILQNAAGEDLARLIIGKPVETETAEDQFGDQKKLRYVRRAGQDQVYRVMVDTSKLSTTFGDWIKKDLLDIDTYDITQLTLNDYSVVDTQGGGKRPLITALLTFAFKDSAWKLTEMVESTEEGELSPAELKEDEEPNTQKLNDLKFALDDLEIVDVYKKPAVLADLMRKGHPFPYQDPRQVADEALESLQDHGFYFYPGEPPKGFTQLFSDAGDFFVRTNDGVEYLIRFGNIAPPLRSMSSEGKKDDGSGEKEKLGLNRFVMVTARLDKDLIEKPVVKPYPDETPAGGEKEPVDAGAESATPGTPSSETPSGESQPKEGDAEKEGMEGETTEDQDVGQDAPAAQQDPAAEPTEQPADEATPQDESDEEPKQPAAGEGEKQPEVKLDPVAAARKKIDDENKKAQEDYDKKVKEAEEKVAKLNARFADWYFVVSEDVYKKLRLGREDAIQKKGAKPADDDGGLPNLGPIMP
jgi:hypothetical protein